MRSSCAASSTSIRHCEAERALRDKPDGRARERKTCVGEKTKNLRSEEDAAAAVVLAARARTSFKLRGEDDGSWWRRRRQNRMCASDLDWPKFRPFLMQDRLPECRMMVRSGQLSDESVHEMDMG